MVDLTDAYAFNDVAQGQPFGAGDTGRLLKDLRISGDLQADSATFATVSVTGAETVGGSFVANGGATISGGLIVASGNLVVSAGGISAVGLSSSSGLTVTAGATVLSGGLQVAAGNLIANAGNAQLASALGTLGFFGAAGSTRSTITGSRSGATVTVLGALLAALASLGIINDGTTP